MEVIENGKIVGKFTGGAVGFISYEFSHDGEPVVPRPVGTPGPIEIVGYHQLSSEQVNR